MIDVSSAIDEAKVGDDEFKVILQRVRRADPSDAAETLERMVASGDDLLTDAEPSRFKRIALILLRLIYAAKSGGPQLCESHAFLLGQAQTALNLLPGIVQSVEAIMMGPRRRPSLEQRRATRPAPRRRERGARRAVWQFEQV